MRFTHFSLTFGLGSVMGPCPHSGSSNCSFFVRKYFKELKDICPFVAYSNGYTGHMSVDAVA